MQLDTSVTSRASIGPERCLNMTDPSASIIIVGATMWFISPLCPYSNAIDGAHLGTKQLLQPMQKRQVFEFPFRRRRKGSTQSRHSSQQFDTLFVPSLPIPGAITVIPN
jgi:hypothetical protein